MLRGGTSLYHHRVVVCVRAVGLVFLAHSSGSRVSSSMTFRRCIMTLTTFYVINLLPRILMFQGEKGLLPLEAYARLGKALCGSSPRQYFVKHAVRAMTELRDFAIALRQ